jgi:hypothetical protein
MAPPFAPGWKTENWFSRRWKRKNQTDSSLFEKKDVLTGSAVSV